MNRPLLFSFLGLSLFGNAWFLFAAREPAATSTLALPSAQAPAAKNAAPVAAGSTPPPATTGASSAPGDPASAAAPRGLVWRTPRSDDDYRALAADLRAAGFPSRLIYRVLADLHLQQRLAERALAKVPYWQRTAVEQSPEMRTLRRAASDRIAELLGPDGRPSARLNAVTRKRQYGSLSDAKIDAIGEIERDYQEMQSDVYGPGSVMAIEDFSAQQKQVALLRAEKLADLAKLLTPSELAEYQLHNSDAARRTAMSVRDVPLAADDFAALVRARETYDAVNVPGAANFTPEAQQRLQAAQAAYYEQMRAILPDGRFYDILANSDPGYRAIAGLRTQFPIVTPAAAYRALQVRNEAQQDMATLMRDRPTPETIQSTYAAWNSRLDAVLGAEAAAAYRKTSQGRIFNAPTPRPRANPATPPKG